MKDYSANKNRKKAKQKNQAQKRLESFEWLLGASEIVALFYFITQVLTY